MYKSLITLNDYLYSGHTVLRILKKYRADLYEDSLQTGNRIDQMHCELLDQITAFLVHNDFLTGQSQIIREFYKYMAGRYPFLAFTMKGRIKSLIRAEAKFNGYVVEFIHEYYLKNGTFPDPEELKEKLNCFRDFIAYRIVISMPKCHLGPGEEQREIELRYLYEIANELPGFMKKRGFRVEATGGVKESTSPLLEDAFKPYYRDYIRENGGEGYESLHITFYDETAKCFLEIQLRTKSMDDYAEIGPANHWGYEKKQEAERGRRGKIPKGECVYFDEAYERCQLLQNLELSQVDVNMFGAMDNYLINDGCGLYRGRLILPFEHLSHFQNDRVD